MSIVSNVTNMVTRRRILVAAEALAKGNTADAEKYDELLAAVGAMFSEEFGIDCSVVITCDKDALMEKVLKFEEEERNARSGN